MSGTSQPRVREAPFGYVQTLVPGVKEALASLSAALWHPDGSVPERLKELVFLRTSIINRCET